MADNVAITAGSGTTIAADDIGGVLHQRVKISQGADGSATDVSSAAPLQVTGANGTFPVTDNSGSLTVDNAGTFAVQAAQSGTWNITNVSGTVSLPTGAATAAKQPALGTAGSASADVITVQGIASGTNLNVNIAAAGTSFTVQDGGGSITVDNNGTFATQASIAAGATNIAKAEDAASADADVGVPAMAVRKGTPANTSGTDGDYEMLQMSAGRLWTSATIDAALPAGTNAIGKLAANSGVDIGDVDVTSVVPGTTATSLGKAEDAGHSSGDTGVMALGVRVDSPDTALAGTALDYSPLATSSTGAVRTAPMSEDFAALANGPQVKKYYTNAGAVTDGIVWSPAAGKRWYVTDIFINVSAAATVTLEDDLVAGDAAVWKAELAANSGWSHSFNTPLFSGEDAADLLITTSAGNVYVMVTGYEI